MLSGIKKALGKQAMKFMQSDTAMKLMQDQRVMNGVMKFFALREKVQGSLDGLSDRIAKSLGFATREEVQKLKAVIQDLESSLERLKSEQESLKARESAKKENAVSTASAAD